MKSAWLGAAALTVATVLAAPAAHAAPPRYAALGDSFSAGVGTRNKVNACYQSPEGYPVLVANAAGWQLNYQACLGATILDVLNKQLPAVAGSTNRITLTAGGNDAGFAPVLTECAKPGWLSNCPGAMDRAESKIRNDIPGRLTTLYTAIRSKAPVAQASAVGYPRLFNGTDCNVLTFFSSAEESRLNYLTDLLDTITRDRASGAGLGFVDPRAAFTGHAWCSSSEYVNGLSYPTEESYHPNDAGNVAYAAVVGSVSGVSVARTPTVSGAAAASPRYSAVLPDLASPANLRRAQRAGINPTLIRRLDADLRSGNAQRGKAAVLRLQQLDAAYAKTHRSR